ncbi:MAG: TldD/PmbA family protein [Candidatus Helarchaeota archaeon]
MKENDLINLGKNSINEMKKQGIDQSEIFVTKSRDISIEIEKGSIKYAKEVSDFGCSIRAIKNGCIGFSYTTSITQNSMKNLINRVVKLAKVGLYDPDFKSLPEPKKIYKIHGTYDPKIAYIEVNEAIELISDLIDYANIDNRIYSINASINCSFEEIFIMNSLGVEAIAEKQNGYTSISISAEITAKQHNEMSSGFEFENGRFRNEIDIEEIGIKAAKLALESLGAKKIETCELPIIFHPISAYNILSSAIGNAINAESVQYGRSYLMNKLNEKIATKNFEVIDDGTFVNNGIAGLGSSSFDGEGTPRQKNQIISKGILKKFLYNSYSAGKENLKSTGNAFRDNFRKMPSISPTNLIITPGTGTIDEIISETKEGILVVWTGDKPNLVTGEFSGLIGTGFKVKNGEITFPLKQTMLGINMLDFFKRIDYIAADSRQISHVITPSIRITKGKIGGK